MLGILEFLASLRGSKATEAISRNSLQKIQGNSKFPTMSSPDLIGGSHQIAVIAEIPSL